MVAIEAMFRFQNLESIIYKIYLIYSLVGFVLGFFSEIVVLALDP